MKDKILNPFALWVSRYVSAGLMTIIALLFGIASAASVLLGQYSMALILWIINRILDGLDGQIARASRTQSDEGGYLDIVCDFIVYALIPVAISLQKGSRASYISTLFLLAAFYVNSATWMYLSALLEKRAAGAAAQNESTSVTISRGLIEGTETVLFYTLFLLFPRYYVFSASIMAALTVIGALLRTAKGYSILKNK
ncbi:CDP-alcohol phosphatidyltransferase family protein [Oceanispirochaeta sp.]|uniref:CDP-alcohol phosphatidyltransferase family protein n=1 Tax=Oceanispirochaeta sp. TaxID=2035350 RepID=UPI002637C8D6|nr:CDP-alcohol phosphatidyltransferase family protein [Oceanispirochaeta sp.]MDA3957131.1 CDP-alcohol phosphatidyltransferase family protein [Oceanispirochaeta sp.]